MEVKIRCKIALGPRIVSAVRSLEVVASGRLPMYYRYIWDFQSVTRALSALGSVSASRSVRSGGSAHMNSFAICELGGLICGSMAYEIQFLHTIVNAVVI